jgi:hypothetical protein
MTKIYTAPLGVGWEDGGPKSAPEYARSKNFGWLNRGLLYLSANCERNFLESSDGVVKAKAFIFARGGGCELVRVLSILLKPLIFL